MTPAEYEAHTRLVRGAAQERDRAENRATAWKCLAVAILFLLLFILADKWGWLPGTP